MEQFTGLSEAEVEQKKSLGLSNQVIDAYTPSKIKIILRNTFNLINIVLIPLLVTLVSFGLYSEVLAFSTFAILNSIVSILDELRIKKQLDKLKEQFQITTKVIRDSKEIEIPISEIVEGDYVKAAEGEAIIADGKIVFANYLQLDESALTGESNYIQKFALSPSAASNANNNGINENNDNKVLAGSYVVTGDCIYVVESVGKNNYLNKIGTEALKYKEQKSKLQQDGDKLILFLVFASIILGLANFYLTGLADIPIEQRVLGLTTIIVLIIPQTLIFLFTLTFTISITKLYNKGVLIQKGGSIEELSNINVICFDKTGTITTNDMKIIDVKAMNIDEQKIGEFYNSVKEKIVGVNKTQSLLNQYFNKYGKINTENFDQIPFTSKQKFSLVTAKVTSESVGIETVEQGEFRTLVFGAFSMLQNKIAENLRSEVGKYVEDAELQGNRVLVGIYLESSAKPEINSSSQTGNSAQNGNNIQSGSNILDSLPSSEQIIIFTIEEELNPGIKEILNDLKTQGIAIKIISGDSLNSVRKILQKIGIDASEAVDLSVELATDNNTANSLQVNNETTDAAIQKRLQNLALSKTVFTRAKPEDKLQIIQALQKNGFKVAMTGDGINDVLSIKAADVAISMEHGSKVARDSADIVLLNNDFSKVPMIFFEGENILFNLLLSTKLFLFKSFVAIIAAVYFTVIKLPLPIHPSSTLIFSFLGSSALSYVIVFTRQKVENAKNFFRDAFSNTIPQSVIIAAGIIYIFYSLKNQFYSAIQIDTAIIMYLLFTSLLYSLHQVWLSKKLKNIFFAGFIFLVLCLVGVFQTILPVTQYDVDLERIIIIFFVFIAGLIMLITLFKVFKPKTIKKKILVLFASFVWCPIVLYFPFNSYYHVIRLSVDIYKQLAIESLVSFIAIIIVTRIFRVK